MNSLYLSTLKQHPFIKIFIVFISWANGSADKVSAFSNWISPLHSSSFLFSFLETAYNHPRLCQESRPTGFFISTHHIPELHATGVLFGSGQSPQPLQSWEPGSAPPETPQQGVARERLWQVQGPVCKFSSNRKDRFLLLIHVWNIFFRVAFRPGKSPERGGRQMENYEPISPPQGYQGMDKQEAGGPSSQRRDTDNSEIRYAVWSVYVRNVFNSHSAAFRVKLLEWSLDPTQQCG